MFRFPAPSLSWLSREGWVGRAKNKKGMNTWRVLRASEGRAAKYRAKVGLRGPFVRNQYPDSIDDNLRQLLVLIRQDRVLVN